MKTILFYTAFYSWTVEEFIKNVNEIADTDDFKVRMNSPGGGVFAGWGMCSVVSEHKGKTHLRVDGNASSMGFYFSLFFDYVEALDVTSFMIHRATGWVQTDEDRAQLDKINKDLRSKFEARIDKKLFEEITGVTVKDIFEGEDRKDVWLTARQAKKVGLVDKVVKLEPAEMRSISANLVAFTDFDATEQGVQTSSQGEQAKNEVKEAENNNNLKTEKEMTVSELKEKHPELYAKIIEAGKSEEKDRVQAWLAFADVDMEAVSNGIEKGDNVTQKVIAEMARKAMAVKEVEKTKEDSPDAIDTPDEGKDGKVKTAEEKEAEEAEAEAMKAAGINIEKE
jgi:ATP-dependent protease ClpP protease subunit